MMPSWSARIFAPSAAATRILVMVNFSALVSFFKFVFLSFFHIVWIMFSSVRAFESNSSEVSAYLPTSRSFLSRVMHKLKISQGELKTNSLLIAVFSALAYSLYFIGSKYAYNTQPFGSVFIWTRLGSVLFVLLFLKVSIYKSFHFWLQFLYSHHKKTW